MRSVPRRKLACGQASNHLPGGRRVTGRPERNGGAAERVDVPADWVVLLLAERSRRRPATRTATRYRLTTLIVTQPDV